MPVAGFICPDEKTVLIEDCLRECRLRDKFPTGRCKALPFLKRAGRDRHWNGKPSVTQILSGTREQFLKITRPYFINPFQKVAAIIGTNTHNVMYRLTESEYAEETLYNQLVHGTYDVYDPDTKTLYDYKTWGAWKIAKALSGNDDEKAEALFEVVLQMNQYRILLKQKYPQLEINSMAVQVISREVGLRQTKERGIVDAAPVILIPEINSSLVTRYQEIKSDCLNQAFVYDWAPPCRARETWNGKKCEKYCEVRDICKTMKNYSERMLWWIRQESELKSIEESIVKTIKSALKESRTLSGYQTG